MTDATLDRALLRGDWQALRDADEDLVRLDIDRWLDRAMEDPDAYHEDKLMGHGVTWARSGRRDPDRMALRWLESGGKEPRRLMAVLPFLSGFWGQCARPVPGDRPEGLIRARDEVALKDDRLDYWLLLALSEALRNGVSDPDRVRARVEALAARSWPADVAPIVSLIAARALE